MKAKKPRLRAAQEPAEPAPPATPGGVADDEQRIPDPLQATNAVGGDEPAGTRPGAQHDPAPGLPFARRMYLGRPRPASEFEHTAAEVLAWAEAEGCATDGLREFVAHDTLLRAQRIALEQASRKRAPGAGRPKTPAPPETQYDVAYKRRRGLYQRLVKSRTARVGTGKVPEAQIIAIASRLKKGKVRRTGRDGWASRIYAELRQVAAEAALRLLANGPRAVAPVPDMSTIRKVLLKHFGPPRR